MSDDLQDRVRALLRDLDAGRLGESAMVDLLRAEVAPDIHEPVLDEEVPDPILGQRAAFRAYAILGRVRSEL